MKNLLNLLLLLTFFPAFTQQNGAYFKHITSDDGLPSNYIETIIQDQEGFMWFGTAEGLARFDGYSFVNFSNLQYDSTSLINSNIKCIAEDKHHNFWIGTQKGITYFDLNTYRFKRFTGKFKNSIGTEWISAISVIDDDNLLIGTYYKGIYLFNLRTKVLKTFKSNPLDNNSIVNNTIRVILKDKQNKIWIATDGGLEIFNLKHEKFKHLLKGENVQNICFDGRGNIFATTIGSSNMYTIDIRTLQVIGVQEHLDKRKDQLKRAYFDSFGNRWLSVLGGGIYYTDVKDDTEVHWTFDKYNTDGINSKSPLVIYEDRTTNIWIGTFDGGVNFYDRHRKKFVKIQDNFLPDGLQSNHVRSIFQDRDGDIWIGTKSGGMLSKFNRINFTFKHFKHEQLNPFSINDEIVLSLANAKRGYLWVGTLVGGINLFNKQTGRFIAIKSEPGNSNSLNSNSILTLLNDNVGKLWIGHADQGLDVYDIDKKSFTNYVNTSDINSLSDNRVRVLFKDSKGLLWIGTLQGLNVFDYRNNTFRRFENNQDDINSISDNNILSICEDKYKRLWIGTGNGLNQYDRKNNSFKVYGKHNGFPSKSARGILDDKEGNLWISTDKGLIKFDPNLKKFRYYTKEDGLTSNEFASYSHCKLSTGEMLFGSDNGFVMFNPEDITDNINLPKVVISDFKIYNQNVLIDDGKSPLKKQIARTSEISLNYKQSVITFEFSAINYSSPEKNQYAYMMDGFDKDWNNIGNKREATYTNLPAGDYTFRVKASNNDGIWNEQGTSLKITVIPPPWKTWWAYSIYIILGVITLLKYRDIAIKRIHAKKEHEMDQLKIKLFMNISHEFRTPLTLMINPLNKITVSEDIAEIKSSLRVVQQSAWKLLNLVNQLLDFRKIDQGGSPLKVRMGDIVSFTRYISQLFEEIASEKNIELKFKASINELNVWLDPDKYEKIITNLLSNALKFTDQGGEITVQVGLFKGRLGLNLPQMFTQKKVDEYAEVRVIDTGIGLTRENVKNIFERFYQVDQSKAGTGIGLNYVKSLVELHGGEVLVESEPGKGSCFIIRIPFGDSHLTQDQKVVTTNGFGDYYDKVTFGSLQYDIESSDIDPLYESVGKNNEAFDNKVVLLVEDNKTLRKQIADELNGIYIVKEASNGLEGLEKTQKIFPDLIISDIMMPKMDGIELCQKLKGDINTSHIPIILLTAKSTIENKIEGFETGADEYIPKPFNMELLLIRIKNLILSRAILKEKYSNSKTLAPAKEYTTNNMDEAFLDKATQIVVENIENTDFSLTDLREKLGMSRTNLSNKLLSITGQNPSNFLRTIRLKYAAQLLLQTPQSIKDVCYICGFNSPAYFIKTFRELFGQTPKEYVDSHSKKDFVD